MGTRWYCSGTLAVQLQPKEGIPKGATDDISFASRKECENGFCVVDVWRLVSLTHTGDAKELELTLRLRVFPNVA